MLVAFGVLGVVHGMVHFVGFGKAYELATLPDLQPIPRRLGLLWLVAGLAMFATGVLILLRIPWWPAFGLVSVALSQTAIVTAWGDAKSGTVANVLIVGACVAVLFGFGGFA